MKTKTLKEQALGKRVRELESILKRVECLTAWRELEKSEGQDSSRFHSLAEATQRDLRVEYGRLWELIFALENELDHSSPNTQKRARNNVQKLIQRARRLSFAESFISR